MDSVNRYFQAEIEEWRPGVTTRLKAAASLGASTLCVFEQWCEPGTGAPAHHHPDSEEVLLIIEGTADADIEGDVRRLEDGAAAIIEPGVVHGFVNAGKGVLHTIAIFAASAPKVVYEAAPDVTLLIGAQPGAHRTQAGSP
jgi:quercetin dioxygenase-like cupin family protein